MIAIFSTLSCFLACCIFTVSGQNYVVVNVTQGTVRGLEKENQFNHKKYYSFTGIPFAQPPVGNLRFKAPEPYLKWDHVIDAFEEKPGCMQAGMFPEISQSGALPKLNGSEDCLYLNIFTPQPPSEIKKPKAVMVWVHGGAFYFGKATVGPSFLMDKDIILVAIQYRLHAFGFLNVESEDAPGNAGLKDQTLALKWVQQNIANFGGDPSSVTVFGQSAGGASVHYLTISPLSNQLFQRAILESGLAVASWAINQSPLDSAKQLAEWLGFEGDMNDKKSLVNFLREQDAETLNQKVETMLCGYAKSVHFVPSVEKVGEKDAFLPAKPSELITKVRPMPIIVGLMEDEFGEVTSIEDLVTYGWSPMIINKLCPEPQSSLIQSVLINIAIDFFISREFDHIPLFAKPTILKKLRKFYVDENVPENEILKRLTLVGQDLYNCEFDDYINRTKASSWPIYVYQFAFHGKLRDNPLKPKTTHCDELGYLFYIKPFIHNGTIEPEDLKVIDYMTTFWTSFAKTGIPSHPEVEWKSFQDTSPVFLNISLPSQLVPRRIIEDNNFNLWNDIIKKYKLKFAY